MSVSSTSPVSANQLWELLQSGRTSQSNSNSNKSASSSDASKLSGPGQLFKELEALSKSNPAEFKKITAKISQELHSVSSQSTDVNQTNFLSQMAAHFAAASESANFSDLFSHAGQGSSAAAIGSVQSTNAQSPYAASTAVPSGGNEAVSTIFSQALAQIQSDLSASSTSGS